MAALSLTQDKTGVVGDVAINPFSEDRRSLCEEKGMYFRTLNIADTFDLSDH